MEAMPKNKNEETKLPGWMKSLRLVAGAFFATPKKTTKLDKQLEELREQTNTELEITLFSDKNTNISKKSKKESALSDRLKVKEAKPNSKQQKQQEKETEISKDERV